MPIKTRWDQKTYRRHMFNTNRNTWSPHAATNTRVETDDGVRATGFDGYLERFWRTPWNTNLTAAEEYEQYTNPKTLESHIATGADTMREEYRKQDREVVKKMFRDQFVRHHYVKSRKGLSSGQLDKLAEAYMTQDDDTFLATLNGMGMNKRDAGRFLKAAGEAATAAIEGRSYGTSWGDDPYEKEDAAREAAAAKAKAEAEAASPEKPVSGGQASGGPAANGKPKVGPGAAPEQATPLKAKPQARADEPLVDTAGGSSRRFGQRAGLNPNLVGGDYVSKDGPAAMHVEQANTARASVAAMQARDSAQRQVAVSSLTPSEAYELRQNERDRIDQIGKDRRARQAAEREAAAQRRADKRFADRTLYNEADWKNLGREGSNKADYSDRREGESDKDWAVRDKARQERQGRMAALLTRLDEMRVQDATKNSFYANDPNKQQNLARLRGLIVKAGADGKDAVRDDITDAQIEGANATLDAWEKGAREKGARQKAFTDMKNAEEVSQLRQKYGLNYGEFTADQVRDYHQRRQTEERKRILSRMQVAPGLTPESEEAVAHTDLPGGDGRTPVTSYSVERKDMRPAAMAKFAQDWQALLDTGFNPTTTFQKLMESDDMRKAFEAGLDTIPLDDPDRADKRDQLRRRMIVQQAMADAGLEGLNGATGKPGQRISYIPLGTNAQLAADPELNDRDSAVYGETLAQNLPGKSILAPTRGAAEAVAGALQPKQPQQTPGVQVFTNPADALKARNDLNATAGLRPRQQARLRPGDKREETMAW